MIDATSGLWVIRLGLVIAGLAGWFWTQRLIGQRAWLLILYALRQICQGLCALPPPDGMIWRRPGIPSLLVTYGTATDLFFSGHTAIAVFGCIELAHWRADSARPRRLSSRSSRRQRCWCSARTTRWTCSRRS